MEKIAYSFSSSSRTSFTNIHHSELDQKFSSICTPSDNPPLAFETFIGTPLSTKYQKFLIYFESNIKGFLYY